MGIPQASEPEQVPPDRPTPSRAGGRRGFRFPRAGRILRKADFDRAMKQGVRAADERLTLWALPNDLGLARLGLTVGRKHGAAVRRNRLKRILREAFRLSQHELPAGLDLVCAPRSGRDLGLEHCRDSLVRLAVRLAQRLAKDWSGD